MKLVKTDKRNRLSEKNLEALLLIIQHYKEQFKEISDNKKIGMTIIEDELVEKFLKLRNDFNASKNLSKKNNNIIHNKGLQEEKLEESQSNFEMERDMSPLIEERSDNNDQNSQQSGLKRKEPSNNPEELFSFGYPLSKPKPSNNS